MLLVCKRILMCTNLQDEFFFKSKMLLSPFMYTGGGIFVVCCVSLLLVELASVQVVLIKSWILQCCFDCYVNVIIYLPRCKGARLHIVSKFYLYWGFSRSITQSKTSWYQYFNWDLHQLLCATQSPIWHSNVRPHCLNPHCLNARNAFIE